MKSKKARTLTVLVALLSLAVAVRLGGLDAYLDEERLREEIDRWGMWGPSIYILIFTIAPPLFLPGFPIAVAGGLVFGPIWGTLYASVGSSLGAGVAFLVERLGERWKKIDEEVAQRGWVYVAITRLVPFFPFNLLNYAFGLTKIRFGTFFFATTLFKLPGVAAYVVFSSSLLGLLKEKVSPPFLIGLILFLLVLLIPFLYRKWKGGRGSLPGDEARAR